MSGIEILFRGAQFFKKALEKNGFKTVNHTDQNYKHVLVNSYNSTIDPIPRELSKEFEVYNSFNFFGYSISLAQPINWHLDVTSHKCFPLHFSKDIDIRSDKYGSAKAVWEVNRLQFLLPLAVKYNQSKTTEDLEAWIKIVKSWIENNPYLKGVNWYSNIEVNIRLIVWYFCWQILFQNEELKSNKAFTAFAEEVWLPSIYEHCFYSYNNPSKFSSANNHLISEYSGLFVAASCWSFSESKKWKTYAHKGLEKEIKLQHSENGINKEEAAEYIQFITDFLLIPYAVGNKRGVSFSEEYKLYFFRISDYINTLLDCGKNYVKYGDEDDGKVLVVSRDPHFNNFSSILTSAAVIFSDERFKNNGVKYDLKNWLLWGDEGYQNYNKLKEKPLLRVSSFYKSEGHFFFRKVEPASTNREIYFHFDAAPLGFLSIAAHGHADALSVALHVDGNPIITDVGTYTYHTEKKWRNYFISTLAHNTVCIDNANQAYQAGPTMWLNHYSTKVLEVVQNEENETVSATHNGYKNIGCSHLRTVFFNRSEGHFTITDEIDVNDKTHHIIQPWHLHPEVVIEQAASHTFILKHKKGTRSVRLICDPGLNLQFAKGNQSPVFGWFSESFLQKQATKVIAGHIETSGVQKIFLSTTIEII